MVLGAVHLKHITDLAWSPCGCFLAAASHDGYCTIAHFQPNELGIPLKSEIPDSQTIRLGMQRQRQTKVCTAMWTHAPACSALQSRCLRCVPH